MSKEKEKTQENEKFIPSKNKNFFKAIGHSIMPNNRFCNFLRNDEFSIRIYC